MKTLLVGNFGDHNLGDELILAAALESYPDVVVMTSDPVFSRTFTERDFETVPFPPTGLRSWIRYYTNRRSRLEVEKLRRVKIEEIVFPGGGLFAIKTKACVLWWLVFRFLKKSFPAAEIRFEHQGVDQRLSWLGKRLAKRVFGQADFVSVRDGVSGGALEVLGIREVVLGEDRVFEWLESSKQKAESSRDSSRAVQPTCLVNAVKPFNVEKIEAKYPEHRIVFVPFARYDLSVLPDNFPHEVIFPQTKTELLDLLNQADVLIGERFHSIVCGYHFCGPEKIFTLRDPYSEKVAAFCKVHKIKSL